MTKPIENYEQSGDANPYKQVTREEDPPRTLSISGGFVGRAVAILCAFLLLIFIVVYIMSPAFWGNNPASAGPSTMMGQFVAIIAIVALGWLALYAFFRSD